LCASVPQDQKGGFLNNDIKWNFSKFLVDREGNVVGRCAELIGWCEQCMQELGLSAP
jgi:glutathione peroxidase-family protein